MHCTLKPIHKCWVNISPTSTISIVKMKKKKIFKHWELLGICSGTARFWLTVARRLSSLRRGLSAGGFLTLFHWISIEIGSLMAAFLHCSAPVKRHKRFQENSINRLHFSLEKWGRKAASVLHFIPFHLPIFTVAKSSSTNYTEKKIISLT